MLADIPRLIRIRGAVRENRLSDPGLATAADYRRYVVQAQCWVAEVDGKIVGFSALDAEQASVWALFVAPAAAGRGTGKLLLDALVTDARRRGLPLLRLETEAGSRAESFYRGAGWSVVAQDSDGTLKLERAL